MPGLLGGNGSGRRRLPHLPDGNARQVLAAAVDQVDDPARNEDRREHRGHDAEAVDDGEAAHRSGAEGQERDAGDQRRHVRVEDRAERALVACVQRRVRCRTPAQLLADALVDEDVGVDRHAERQRDGRDAGQRQRRLQHRQEGHEQHQVDGQRDRGDEAHQQVIDAHEDGQHDEAVEHRVESLVDVLLAERGADGALLDDLHRRGERAGAHQQRDVVRFASVHAAADLDSSAADLLADHRRRNDLGLALLDEHDRHSLADVLARDLLEDARAGAVQAHVHGRLVVALVETGLRVVDSIPRQDHLPSHEDRPSGALDEKVAAERRLSGNRRFERARLVVDHPDLERRGAPQDVFRARRVLHARKLHDDAVDALLLDDRLGDAELVDAIAQDGDVLLDGAVLDLLLRLGLQAPDQPEFTRLLDLAQREVRERLLDLGAGLAALGLVAEADDDVRALAPHAGVLHFLLPHQRADVGGVAVGRLVERGLHVDLQQEVHAAAKIEAEIHRQGADCGQPARRRGEQVERDDVAFTELRLQRILRLELRVGVVEAKLDARRIEHRAAVRNIRGFERLLDARQKGAVDFDGRLRRRHLNGGNLGEKIRDREDDADDERDGDDHVLPERIAIHGVYSALIVPFGSSWAMAPRCTMISVPLAISRVRY